MSVSTRLRYWRRLAGAYLPGATSQLTFWHEAPEADESAVSDQLGPYYMLFSRKAGYSAHIDSAGVPMLDYHGSIGLQYNPIAIAQWGLGNYNLFRSTGDQRRKQKFLAASDWLVDNLAENEQGIPVWSHHFDWEYRDTLRSPWYSGLAQGQGISLLVRAAEVTEDARYMTTAADAYRSLCVGVDAGGVLYEDDEGSPWVEEYIVDPPTHILNGFIWGLWGVRDYWLATGDSGALDLWQRCVGTLTVNLDRFDTGYWSLYDQSAPGRLKMMASGFYHRLHIVQLSVMYNLTGETLFREYTEKWDGYANRRVNRTYSRAYKSVFKVLHY